MSAPRAGAARGSDLVTGDLTGACGACPNDAAVIVRVAMIATRIERSYDFAAFALRVAAAFLPAARRFRVSAAFFAAARRLRVRAAFWPGVSSVSSAIRQFYMNQDCAGG